MLNSLNEPTRCRNHSRATKIGVRIWKRNALCSNGVPCRSRMRNFTSPTSDSSMSSLRRAKETRAAFTTDRSSAIAASRRTKPWSRTSIWPSGSGNASVMSRRTLAAASVGTSGFGYPTWRGAFYPETAKPEFLRLYAERLPAVELNGTFYRLPSEAQLLAWADVTPSGFRFTVKVARGISHGGRTDFLPTFCERVRILGDRLGPLLVRLSSKRPRDDGFLGLLLDSFDPALQVAIEFRNETWDHPAVDAFLAERGAVRVNGTQPEAPFRYHRWRDPPYPDDRLAAIAADIEADLAAGRPVYGFFKHEDDPWGALAALRLLELLG